MVACNKGTRARIWEQPLNEREQKYIEKIYKFIGSMVWQSAPKRHRRNEALMSDAWFRAYKAAARAAKKYDGRSAETTFAYWPIKGELNKFWHNQKKQLLFDSSVMFDLENAVYASHGLTNFVMDFAADPAKIVEREESVVAMMGRLERHNKAWYESVALKFGFPCGDYDCEERNNGAVAKLIGCTPDLVRARVVRGLDYLRSISEE